MFISEISKEVADEMGLDRKLMAKIFALLQKKIREKLIFGQEIEFYQIGRLHLKIRQPKKFKNLQTGKMQMTKLRYIVRWESTRGFDYRIRDKKVFQGNETEA